MIRSIPLPHPGHFCLALSLEFCNSSIVFPQDLHWYS
jgi:hypothetical protein